MNRVCLEEVNLPHPNERPGLLGFVSKGIHYLEGFQRQVSVASDPQREHGVHRSLGSRSQEHGNLKFGIASVLHPVHFFLESGFFFIHPQFRSIDPSVPRGLEVGNQLILFIEQVLGYKQRKIVFLVTSAPHL